MFCAPKFFSTLLKGVVTKTVIRMGNKMKKKFTFESDFLMVSISRKRVLEGRGGKKRRGKERHG